MASKLVLRNTQNAKPNVDLSVLGVSDVFDMLLNQFGSGTVDWIVATAASGTEILWTKTSGGLAFCYVSPPLASGFTLTSTDLSIWALESNMNANAGGRYRVFRYQPGNPPTLTELGGGPFNDGIEFGTAITEMTWIGNVTDQAFSAGDRVVLKIYITNIGTMGGGFTCTQRINGADAATGDSFFNLAETVTFSPEPQTISGAGNIGSAEALGSPTLQFAQTITCNPIGSAESFGTAKVNIEIDPAGGIASAQAFGSVKINLILPSVGNIASAGAFGAAKVNLTVNPSGIASAGAFGIAKVNQSISLSSIGSSEAIGSHTISTIGAAQFIGPASSIDAFNRADSNSLGSPWVESEANIANIGIAGNQLAIVSATAGVAYWNQDVFGQNYFSEVVVKQHIDGHAGPAIRVQVGSIYTSYSGYFVAVEATGLRLYKGAGVSLLAIGNLTQIGSFVGTINVGDAIRLEGYGTTITVRQNGVSRISVTDAALSGGRPGVTTVEDSVSGANGRYDNWGAGPGSVPSSEAFGLASAHRVLGAIPIGTGEAFGSHALIQEQFVAPGAIASGGAVGSHTAYQGGAQSILAQGIASAQTLGSPRVIRWPSYHSGHPQRAEASMRQRNEAVRAG